MIRSVQPALITLVVALSGAALFDFLGAPAGPLVGAAVASTAAAAIGVKMKLPDFLRNLGLTVIGVTLGAGMSPHFFSDAARYPASLAALTLTVILTMAVAGFALRRLFNLTNSTAILATAPGALSYTLAIAADRPNGDANVELVMVAQTIRLLLLTTLLPPAITAIETSVGGEFGTYVARDTLGIPPSMLLIAVGMLGGYIFRNSKLPTPYLFVGLIISGIGHGFGLLDGRPHTSFTFIGFAMAGAMIGTRFSLVSGRQVRAFLAAALVSSSIAFTLSGFISFGVAEALDLSFGQVWVSFAPGGVEGMSAMALSLGYDPAYVATHHIFRLFTLIAFLPFIVRWFARPHKQTVK